MKNWKEDARDRLRDYPRRKNAAERLPGEIAALKSKFESIHAVSLDGTPSRGGSGSTREDLLIENIQQRGELSEALRRTRHYVRAVESALDTLPEDERIMLDRMYMHPVPGKAHRLMEELCLSDQRALYHSLDKALRHFTLAYFGVTEL